MGNETQYIVLLSSRHRRALLLRNDESLCDRHRKHPSRSEAPTSLLTTTVPAKNCSANDRSACLAPGIERSGSVCKCERLRIGTMKVRRYRAQLVEKLGKRFIGERLRARLFFDEQLEWRRVLPQLAWNKQPFSSSFSSSPVYALW